MGEKGVNRACKLANPRLNWKSDGPCVAVFIDTDGGGNFPHGLCGLRMGSGW